MEIAEIINFQRDNSLEITVTSILLALGIPAHIKGYQYVRAAIVMTIRDREAVNLITKVIYPGIAKMFSTTPSCVGRAICHAISMAWQRSDTELLDKFFNGLKSGIEKRPTNGEFIAAVADWVIINRKDSQRNLNDN